MLRFASHFTLQFNCIRHFSKNAKKFNSNEAKEWLQLAQRAVHEKKVNKAIEYLRHSLLIHHNDANLRFAAIKELSLLLYSSNQFRETHELLKQTKTLLSQLPNEEQQMYFGIYSLMLARNGDWEKAFHYMKQLPTGFVTKNELQFWSQLYYEIGMLFYKYGIFEPAKTYLEISLNLAKKCSNQELIHLLYIELGNLHQDKGEEIEAIKYFKSGANDAFGNDILLLSALAHLAECQLSINQIDEALKNAELARNICSQLSKKQKNEDLLHILLRMLIVQSKCFHSQKQSDKSINITKIALSLADKNGLIIRKIELLLNLAIIHIDLQDFSTASEILNTVTPLLDKTNGFDYYNLKIHYLFVFARYYEQQDFNNQSASCIEAAIPLCKKIYPPNSKEIQSVYEQAIYLYSRSLRQEKLEMMIDDVSVNMKPTTFMKKCLINSYMMNEMYEQAIPILEEMIQEEEEVRFSLITLQECYIQLGRDGKAKECILKLEIYF